MIKRPKCLFLSVSDVEEKKHWYTNTPFAKWWFGITDVNPMITAVCVNGGGIYSFILSARLRADSKARKGAAVSSKKKL
jgi:hypothetical protein